MRERPTAGDQTQESLATVLSEAACGRFPAADGSWAIVEPWREGLEAVVALTGHAFFAVGADVSTVRLAALGADGFGGAHDPRLISALAGPDGWIDSLDVLMATTGCGQDTGGGGDGPALIDRPDLAGHPRVRHAANVRSDVQVFGTAEMSDRSVAIVASGIAGLPELSFELTAGARGRGQGPAFVTAARRKVAANAPILASVAPGNAASLRALIGAGFSPIGSVQLFRRAPIGPDAAGAHRSRS